MSFHLDFLNKNAYRKYPLRATASLVDSNGVAIPNGLLTSMQISTDLSNSQLYIGQIYINDTYLSIVIMNYSSGTTVGYFNGTITGDFQSYTLSTIDNITTGSMTVGTMLDISNMPNGMHFFDKDAGRLEDSIISCYIPPAISSLEIGTSKLVGNITFSGSNVTITALNDIIDLAVINKLKVLSVSEKSGANNTCDLPTITSINSVTPDINGNINIYAVSPFTMTVNGSVAVLQPGSTLTITEICPKSDILAPPIDNSDVYNGDILTITTPEWKSWPKYS